MTPSRGVLHYTHASGSGAARYVAGLCRALHAAGVDLELICPADFVYASELSDQDVPVIRTSSSLVGARGAPGKLWRAAAQVWHGWLTVRRRRGSAAIIHVNFPGIEPLACLSLLGFRVLRLRVILTVHDVIPHRWRLPRPLRPLEIGVLAVLYRSAHRLVVHDPAAASTLKRRFRQQAQRICVIPLGAEVDGAAPLLPPPSDELRVLLFGALRENKGIHLAVPAVQALRREGIRVRLRIAGAAERSERGYWTRCRAQIDRQPDGIEVEEGFIPDERLRRLLAAADVVLLPYTSFASQSGVAVLALSAGRPLVTTRAGGLASLVSDSGATVPIEQPTVDGIAAALRVVCGLPPAALEDMGRRGSAYVEDALAWPRLVPRYLALYREEGL